MFTPDEESGSSTEEEREIENEREGSEDVVDSRGGRGEEELWNSSNRESPESQKQKVSPNNKAFFDKIRASHSAQI